MKLVKGLLLTASLIFTGQAFADCANIPVVKSCSDLLGRELTGSLEEENSELQVYDRFLNDEEQGFNAVARPLVLTALFELNEADSACMATYLDAIEPLLGCEYAKNYAAANEEQRTVLEAELRDFANTNVGAIALSENVEQMKEAVFSLYNTVAPPEPKNCSNLPVVNTCSDILGRDLTGSLDILNSEVQVYDRFLNDEDQGYNTVARPLVLFALFELNEADSACMATFLDAIEPLLGCGYAKDYAAANDEERTALEAGLRDFANTHIGAIALSENVEQMKEAVFSLYETVSTPAEPAPVDNTEE